MRQGPMTQVSSPPSTTLGRTARAPTVTWRSRIDVFLTIPHALFVIAFIVLNIFVAVTIRAETSRQLMADRLAQRCAFVYLAATNHTNLRNLGSSIQNLNKHFKFDTRYKIIVVHEDIPPLMQGRLQAVSEAPLYFRRFAFDPPRDDASFASGAPKNGTIGNLTVSDVHKRSHQQLFRFWFYTALLNDPTKSSLFKDIDYLVRLDQDWTISAKVKRDFLREFAMSGAQYGHFQHVGKECMQNATATLKQLAISYVELNGITPRSIDLWSSVVRSPSQTCLPFFQPHLELINLRFFRSHSGIQDWIRVVDANGGIFTQGWKDHVLRFITVALYAAPEKIVRYDADSVAYRKLQSAVR